MKRVALAAILCLLTALSCGALDLTPHRRVAGVQDNTSRYFFQDTGKKVGFRLDPKTSVDGNPSRAVFDFSDLGTSGMTITKSSLTPDTPFGGEGIKKYKDLAIAALPPGSTNVVLEKEVPDPISINGWSSHQYVFTCNYYGVSLRKSVTILNFSKKDQLIISISAPPKSYDVAYARARGVLNSIYDMKPDEDLVDHGN